MFPVNFVEFLRTTFLTEHTQRTVSEYYVHDMLLMQKYFNILKDATFWRTLFSWSWEKIYSKLLQPTYFLKILIDAYTSHF